jgi:hypothetical protein
VERILNNGAVLIRRTLATERAQLTSPLERVVALSGSQHAAQQCQLCANLGIVVQKFE